MIDRVEIYPYQRVMENERAKENKKRAWLTGIKIPRWDRMKIKENLNGLAAYLTFSHLMLAGGAVIMSRAFILGELLPFIFAFLAAFAYKKKGNSIIITAFSVLGFISVTSGFARWSNIATIIVLAGVLNYVNVTKEKQWWGLPLITAAVL